jgi:hypothetical protein
MPKLDFDVFVKIAVVCCAALVGMSTYVVFKYPHDNIIEEHAEKIIYSEIGLDIDLSPTSKEPH